jgi:hypothetical protein
MRRDAGAQLERTPECHMWVAILSIHKRYRGGIRRLIRAMVLAEIEKSTQIPVVKLFDVIAGTSTGGILACGFCVPDAEGKPKFSASALVDLYLHEGRPHRWLDGAGRGASRGCPLALTMIITFV